MPFDNAERTAAERLAAIEESHKHFATKEWVQEIFHPIQSGQIRIESALLDLTGKVQSLFAAHDEFLKEQSDQNKERREEERKLHEEQLNALRQRGFMHWISNVGTPVINLLSLVVTLLITAIGGLIWLLSHAK